MKRFTKAGCFPDRLRSWRCLALGMKSYRILMTHALSKERVSMSAGKRGIQIWIKPTDVVKATNGEVKSFSREKH